MVNELFETGELPHPLHPLSVGLKTALQGRTTCRQTTHPRGANFALLSLPCPNMLLHKLVTTPSLSYVITISVNPLLETIKVKRIPVKFPFLPIR